MIRYPLPLTGRARRCTATASTAGNASVALGAARRRPSCLPSRRVFCAAPRSMNQANNMEHLSVGASAALGGVAGVVSALTGAGGGLVLIPALAKLTTMTQQTINGTQHGAVTFSVLLGAANHLQSGACNVPLALMTTLPAILCARMGVQAAHRISSKRLSLVVGVMMLLCAPIMVMKDSAYFPKPKKTPKDPLDLQLYRPPVEPQAELGADVTKVDFTDRVRRDMAGFVAVNAKYVAAGCATGFITGLCGMGGGILMTAYLTATSDMPQESIIGTSLLSIVPTAASATYFNIKAKSLHVPTAMRVGVALGAGVYVTSKYVTHDVPDSVLRGLLATTLGSAALVMVRRGL